MIYLFYGPDKYRLEKRLAEIKQAANIGNDSINYREISGDFNAATISSEAMAMPFLSEKRMLVINGLLASKDKALLAEIVEWIPQVPAETEIVFVEADAPDQRLLITKTLMKAAKVEVFANLTPLETARIIETMVTTRGGQIDKQSASLLQMYLGNDLIKIENEVNKLVSFDRIVNKENIELLVDAGYFNTIFDLTDAIAVRNAKKALQNLEKILENGESEIYLVTMIAMQIRNLMLVRDLKLHGLSESEIISKSKLHPYVVKKCLSQIRNFSIEKLMSIHRNLLDLDVAFKTGSAEPKVLLTKFILDSVI